MRLSSAPPVRLVPDDLFGFNINNHHTKREQIGLLHVILIIQNVALSLYGVAFSIIASRATIGIKSETSDDNCFYFKVVSELAQLLCIREPIFSNSFSSEKPRCFLCADDLEVFFGVLILYEVLRRSPHRPPVAASRFALPVFSLTNGKTAKFE